MSLTVPEPRPRKRNSVKVPFFFIVVAIALLAVLVRLNRSSNEPESLAPAQLYLKDGKLCRTNTGDIFTGHLVENYPDGSKKSRCEVVDGLLEGTSEGWHTNGVLQVTETFHAGVSDGPRKKWYLSGAKLSEATIVQGKMQGTFRAWHENGQLAEEIELKDDQPVGEARAWYPSGFLKSVISTNSLGAPERHHWRDGERLVWPETQPGSR